VIAEYWKDGPHSETPPGHWNLFAQFVSQRDGHGLDDDVKMFFALNGALLDASIAAWDDKRYFNSVRPITAVHYLYAGQPVTAWGGPCRGTQIIDGATWMPYQPSSVITPAFPEFLSGHSTFSAAGAEILKQFTGSDAFGASYTVTPGSSVVEPCTPATAVTLSWDTFSAAADQAGISRQYGGIHFGDADVAGRALGRQVGTQAWNRAQAYISGKG
jgi:PAP2 superfamily